jgi:hypothetical protein
MREMRKRLTSDGWSVKVGPAGMLIDMITLPLTQLFGVPVDPMRDGHVGCFDVVKTLMDLSTVCRKPMDGQYETVQQFIDEIHLVCRRTLLFKSQLSLFGSIGGRHSKADRRAVPTKAGFTRT